MPTELRREACLHWLEAQPDDRAWPDIYCLMACVMVDTKAPASSIHEFWMQMTLRQAFDQAIDQQPITRDQALALLASVAPEEC